MIGAAIGPGSGPIGAGIGAVLGTQVLSLEIALAERAEEAGLEFSNLRWIDRYTVDVVVADEERIFHVVKLSAEAEDQGAEAIADKLYDEFEEYCEQLAAG